MSTPRKPSCHYCGRTWRDAFDREECWGCAACICYVCGVKEGILESDDAGTHYVAPCPACGAAPGVANGTDDGPTNKESES